MGTISKSERELLKAVYRLSQGAGQPGAHTGALAERLGSSPSTVTTAIKRLADRGLLDHIPYRGVGLTEDGSRVAVASIRRHRIVERFLCALGVSPETARRDAEGIEHHVSAETLAAFRAFAERHGVA